MKGAKVQRKKLKADRGFLEIFNQMIGLDDVPTEQIVDKYENLLYYCKIFIGIWKIFSESTIIKNKAKVEFKAVIEEIEIFVKNSTEELNKYIIAEEGPREKKIFNSKLEEELLKMAGKYDNKKLNEVYRGLKKSKLMDMILITYERIGSSLNDFRKKVGAQFHCLSGITPDTCSNAFILDKDFNSKYLAFSGLDFRFLYESFPEDIDILNGLILTSLSKTYKYCGDIYKIYISPDIDVEKFASSFMKRLDEMKKVIPGCDAAFNLIKKSVKLLRTNFDQYYKKYVMTKNPGIIFEEFLVDVAASVKSNVQIRNQIGKIITQVKSQLIKSGKMSKEAENLSNYAEEIFNKFTGTEEQKNETNETIPDSTENK